MERVRLIWLPAGVTEKGLPLLARYLSPGELSRGNRFVRHKDKLLWLSARYLTKRFVGESASLTQNEYGKPFTEGICFNLSHDEDLTGLALADIPVGLDILKEKPADKALADYVLSEAERSSSLSLYDLLAAKEALAKAEGSGLPDDIASVPALPPEGRLIYRNCPFYRKKVPREGYHIFCCLAGSHDFLIQEEVLYEI